MSVPQVHCNINEKMFSATLFLTRLFTGITLLYFTVGCCLFYREFLFNAVALGISIAWAMGGIVTLMLCALLLMLGWFTRWAAGVAVVVTGFSAFVFFASDFNKLYVVLLVLLITALLPATLLGPGRISLDFKHAQRRVEEEFRG